MTKEPSRTSLETYLKYAAVPYAFGFLTVMVHTARYGLPVIQLIDPINLWVGAFPCLLLLAVWKFFQLPQGSAVVEVARHLVDAIGPKRIRAFNLTLSLISIGLIVSAAFVRLAVESPGHRLRAWGTFALLLVSAFAVKWVQVAVHHVLSGSASWGLTYHRLAKFSVVLVALLVFRAYVTGIYPNLPLRYGFGRPAPVKLIVNPAMVPYELIECKNNSHDTAVETRWVLLLYRTGQEHIVLCEQCKAKTLSVSNAAVFGIIWKESTSSGGLAPN